MLSAISACCLAAAYGCVTETHTEHNWIKNGELDSEGNPVYICSECDAVHTHTFSDEYSKDSDGHWFAATCGHSDAKRGYEEHDFDADGVCKVCGYSYSIPVETTYELQFSYYQYNSKGEIIEDSDGYYVYVGVTYTAVETGNSVLTESSIINGETVADGDLVSFKVSKSVYCEYTDNNSYPLVYANNEVIDPDDNGIYSFKVTSDMVTEAGVIIIWVGNVETRQPQITGNGTAEAPWTINTVTDWLYFANCINDKSYYNDLSFNTGYWALGCDLDFEGEYIYMAGDGTTSDYSVFMGNFNGNNYTMSNFIVSNEIDGTVGQYSSYVGLFGAVSAYSGVSAVICNLTVKDFVVEATAPSSSACVVGGLVGYAIGFNISNCHVEGGTITVAGTSDYYSYIGGIAGILQSFLDEDNEEAYYASVQYSSVSDTEMVGAGVLYGAGGISGYVMPYAESAPVYILNSYASDIVISGGVHAGGIAGIIGRYTSLQNTYATGNISAESTFTSYSPDFEGTILDSRYAYAGGIAGYAENDTFIGYSFFIGELSAKSASGNSYAYTGKLYGGYSAAGYADYYSNGLTVMGNLHDNNTAITQSSVTEAALKKLGWNEADWDFSKTYPVINQEDANFSYTITVNVGGDSSNGVGNKVYGVKVNSAETLNVYIPMSYRYLLYDYQDVGGIAIYDRSEDNGNYRTYGYYFDADCTQRIPTCYVPMADMDIYAKYIDCSAVVDKIFYLNGNGTSAELLLYANGLYTYEEGAIYLTGNYEYDGRVLTFKNGYFSRLSPAASDSQRTTYYTFFAEITADGNLKIYDCDTVYTETSSTGYDSLARFYAVSSPLNAVSEENVRFSGKYYDLNGNYYELDKYYSGTYYMNGQYGAIAYTVADGVLNIKIGSRDYVGTLGADGKLISIERNSESTAVYAYDGFEGVWEQAGIVEKIYEFDGKGNWTYTSGLHSEKGTYEVTGGEAVFTLGDGTEVTVTINADGTLDIKQSTGTVAVTYFAENSLAGVWYTYANSVTRYTLTLGGINSKGWGEAVYEGTEGLRYCAVGENIWYIYYGDTVYVVLNYNASTGVLTGTFYDSSADSTVSYSFYQYDVYYGAWAGSTDEFSSISFNGFGMYDVKAQGSGTRAVSGTVTIGGVAVPYTVDRSTGVAKFTYKEVEYTLVYDENTNTISVTYDGGTALLAEFDEYKNVVFKDVNGVTYSFDGRGNFSGAGIAVIDDGNEKTTANYKITDGSIEIISGGKTIKTISARDGGYVITENGTTTDLVISNPFTGAWAVYGMYTQLVIGEIRSIPSDGTDIEVAGSFRGEKITLYYDGGQMRFMYEDTEYYISVLGHGLVLSVTENYADDENCAYLSEPDAFYGEWTGADGSKLKFDGTANSAYVTYGMFEYSGDDIYVGYYSTDISSDGTVTCTYTFNGLAPHTYVLSEDASDADGVYTNGNYYLIPIEE